MPDTTSGKPISKIGIGPMSPEIIDAVYRFSADNNIPMMLIASKNQIDWDGGYVNNWNTAQYRNYLNTMVAKYPDAKVFICRDHCGPGFKNHHLDDTYNTINADIENDFDLIHVDYCHLKGDKTQILEKSQKAIEYILKKNKDILIEVGTDENTGAYLTNLDAIKREMEFFTSITPIHFFVCQTGSLVTETNQAGSFNDTFLRKVKGVANQFGIFLKEHNADYIDKRTIARRSGIIDAVNVAPQYGVIQTKLTLHKAFVYGLDPREFLEEAYQSERWKKWLDVNTRENKYLCSIIAGHYVFSSDAYKKLYEKINSHEDFRETIIQEMMRNFKIYADNL